MRYFIVFLSLVLISVSGIAQVDSTGPGAIAKDHLRRGDYTNAIMVLNRALQSEPDKLEYQKDLAYAYYMKRDYAKGLEIAKPLVKRADADVQSFQIMGMMYKAVEERKDCEKMYREGLRRFPNSGILYNEYGEMLWSKQDFVESVKLWERGILMDPNYPGNYYNAAKFYYFSADKVWGILYGEVFVNLESYTQRTQEIQTQLLDGYKKLFTDSDIMKNQSNRSDFAKAVLANMQKHANIVSGGITVEGLNKLRRAFLEDWNKEDGKRFKYRLFEYQQQLITANMFDAYNQWVFSGANLNQFKEWATAHAEEANTFNSFQRNRVFKLPKGQYYQKIK